LRLAAARTPTLGDVEYQIYRVSQKTIEKNAATTQPYGCVTGVEEGLENGVDRFLGIVLFQSVVAARSGSQVRIVGLQVVGDADANKLLDPSRQAGS
jgi:hypothetical protein